MSPRRVLAALLLALTFLTSGELVCADMLAAATTSAATALNAADDGDYAGDACCEVCLCTCSAQTGATAQPPDGTVVVLVQADATPAPAASTERSSDAPDVRPPLA